MRERGGGGRERERERERESSSSSSSSSNSSSNLVFYAQSTIAVISGRRERERSGNLVSYIALWRTLGETLDCVKI